MAGVRAEGGVDQPIPAGSSPAAWVKGPERFTRSGRTCEWAWEAEGMVGTVLSGVEQFTAARVVRRLRVGEEWLGSCARVMRS